jgi:nucleotide-binding universal stress UspA family protein
MFRDILVPLDGSRFAESALTLAARIARASKSRMHLVLAHQPHPALAGTGEMVVPPVDLFAELQEFDRIYLERTADRLRSGHRVSAQFHQVEGPAGPAICEEATRLDADLVVMATHGRGAFKRFWLGSVADYLVRHLTTPVLMVHPGARQRGRPVRPIHNILVALDLSADSEQILKPVIALAQATGAEITLVHVVELVIQAGHIPEGMPILADEEFLQEARLEASRRLDRIAARVSERGLTVTTRVISGQGAAAALLATLDAIEYDLLALTTHGHGGVHRLLLGSVADKVIRGAAKPVLALRPLTSG